MRICRSVSAVAAIPSPSVLLRQVRIRRPGAVDAGGQMPCLAGKPSVVAAMGTPYDIGYVNSAPAFLAAYGYQGNTLTALVKTKPLCRFGLGSTIR